MVSMFFGCFCGSNLAGVLIDRLNKLKIIGISAISGGKIILQPNPISLDQMIAEIRPGDITILLKPFSPLLDSNMLSLLDSHFWS